MNKLTQIPTPRFHILEATHNVMPTNWGYYWMANTTKNKNLYMKDQKQPNGFEAWSFLGVIIALIISFRIYLQILFDFILNLSDVN